MRFRINSQDVDLSSLNNPGPTFTQFLNERGMKENRDDIGYDVVQDAYYQGWKAALHAVGVAFAKAASKDSA